ncbi:MAG: two-component regulator propeller domain-containing protein [Ferruginibacter sp.]
MKNYLSFLIILSGIFFSCTSDKKEDSSNKDVAAKTLGSKIPDSLTQPVVTYITEANAPKVIKAGKSMIKPLKYPYGIGKPSFTNYNVADGLPNPYIDASAIDREGNLWLSTYAGLSKFDGHSFTNYTTDNGLNSDYFNALLVNTKNKIWISGTDSVKIFDGKRFNSLQLDSTMLVKEVIPIHLFEDRDGAIWFADNRRSGLYKYKDSSYKNYTMADGLLDSSFQKIIQDKKGNLLIHTEKGINQYDGKSFTRYTAIPEKEGKIPRLLLCDSKGNIWYDDGHAGLGKYDGEKLSTNNYKTVINENGISIGQMVEDNYGNYWMIFRSSNRSSRVGLVRFDGNSFIQYTSKDGLPEDDFMSLVADQSGNIWATGSTGISKISYSFLTELEKRDSIAVSSIVNAKTGTKWIYSRYWGIGKYNADHIAFYGKELGLSDSTTIRALFIDNKDNIWFNLTTGFGIGQVFKLIRFDGDSFTVFGKEQGIDLRFVSYIMEDDEHNIWITGRGGLVKFDGKSFTQYKNLKEEGNKIYTTVFRDSKKNLWLGTNDSGLFKYDGVSLFNYNKEDGLPHNVIFKIAEDSTGNIWLATDGGASKFNGTHFTNYRAAEGLSNGVVDVMYEPVNGGLWLATTLGLSFLANAEIEKENPVFQHFNPYTGFDLTDHIPNTLFADKDGIIWGSTYPNNGKFFRFDYKSVKNLNPIPVRIKNIRLDNEIISWEALNKTGNPDSLSRLNEMVLRFGKQLSDEEIRKMKKDFKGVRFDSIISSNLIPANLVLPFKNNNINFEFAALSPSFGKTIRYQYMLEGYDKTWSPLSNKTDASFGNISEGSYTFKVKALNPGGQWSETSYGFRVLPPWWRTWWAYASYILLFVLGIYIFIRWRTKALQKEKFILEHKVNVRTNELRESLENLKSTQTQLIQSEKMASLGELTAGIAHEIQNPLNFVNNFSEVSNELIDEMNTELDKGDINEAKIISSDIKQNLEKINHHGKRADAIVKAMLQHSRSSNGVKESTDINALCDEYLRLSYHGLKAKDKSFNAAMKTDFDDSIGSINIVSQDIGRVLLNLINNAFYAVTEKKKTGVEGYEPTVTITTKKINAKLEISITDNGNGIPDAVKEKIFQPFFTTKPTGQGTGLGLSLSYDIVKAHGGELKVVTRENIETDFIILLPG